MSHSRIAKIKNILKIPNISDDTLIRLLLDLHRFFDKKIVLVIKQIQQKNNIILDSWKRKKIRQYLYYGLNDKSISKYIVNIDSLTYTNNQINKITNDFFKRLNKYNSENIINSIISRYKMLFENNSKKSYKKEWLNFHEEKTKKLYKHSMIVFLLNQEKFRLNNYSINFVFDFINKNYDLLENYRNLFFVIDNKITNKNNVDILWRIIYKIIIYCQFFKEYKKVFTPFDKQKQINKMTEFLNKTIDKKSSLKLSNFFYNSISYGFKFEDCFIKNDQKKIILSFKKICLDESRVPCPSCMSTTQSGNSYSNFF